MRDKKAEALKRGLLAKKFAKTIFDAVLNLIYRSADPAIRIANETKLMERISYVMSTVGYLSHAKSILMATNTHDLQTELNLDQEYTRVGSVAFRNMLQHNTLFEWALSIAVKKIALDQGEALRTLISDSLFDRKNEIYLSSLHKALKKIKVSDDQSCWTWYQQIVAKETKPEKRCSSDADLNPGYKPKRKNSVKKSNLPMINPPISALEAIASDDSPPPDSNAKYADILAKLLLEDTSTAPDSPPETTASRTIAPSPLPAFGPRLFDGWSQDNAAVDDPAFSAVMQAFGFPHG